MGRHASGPKIIARGKKPVLYTEFADGRGKKVWVRIRDRQGRLISPAAPQHEIEAIAWRIFSEWRSKVENAAEREKTVGELTLRYVEKRSNGWSVGTSKRYIPYLEQIEGKLGSTRALQELSVEDAEDFLGVVETTTGWSSGTMERFYWFCRALFTYAHNLGWIRVNPFNLIPPPKVVPVRTSDPFSESEVKLLLAVAYEKFRWFYPAVITGAAVGPRRSELCALRVGDFDPHLGLLHFPSEITKTQEANSIKLPQFARSVLEECTKGRSLDEPLIIKPSGKPLRSKDFDLTCKEGRDSPRVWRKLLIAAGLPLRGFHKLRSALVTNLVNHGRFSVEEVTSITGQSTEVARLHYLKQRIDRQAPIVEHLEQVYGTPRTQTKAGSPPTPPSFIGHVFEEL